MVSRKKKSKHTKNKNKRDIFDKIIDILKEINKARKPHKLATAGVVAAIVGGLLKAQALTATFPKPWDVWGNAVLFISIVLIAFDFMRGGLVD